jgi:hypothetical protein
MFKTTKGRRSLLLAFGLRHSFGIRHWSFRDTILIRVHSRDSRGYEFADAARSARPGFPAFADRLCVALHVDLFQSFDAIFHRFGRSLIFFPG